MHKRVIPNSQLIEFRSQPLLLPHQTHPIEDQINWIPEPSRFEAKSQETVEDGIQWINGDAKKLMVEAPFQWIDLDPFGSPVGFLDTAIQSISRSGVLEVTATDTAKKLFPVPAGPRDITISFSFSALI